jgi:hypothetical protein
MIEYSSGVSYLFTMAQQRSEDPMFTKPRILLATLALALMFISTSAFAGGGPPVKFKDFKYNTQFLVDSLADYQSTGTIPDWYWSDCDFWTNMSNQIAYYFQNEPGFRAKATQRKTVNSWKIHIAKKYGDGIMMMGTFKWRRLKAKQQLAQMNTWTEMFLQAKYSYVSGNRNYYCSAEIICAPEPEPQFSKVVIQEMSVTPQLVPGIHRHMFAFALSLVADDQNWAEDGKIKGALISMVMTNDAFEQVSDCTLENCFPGEECEILSHAQPYYDEESGSAYLDFVNPEAQPGTIIEKGTIEQYNVFCTLTQMAPNTYMEVGFIPGLGTSPNGAIEVEGMDTNQILVVEPNIPITSFLTTTN